MLAGAKLLTFAASVNPGQRPPPPFDRPGGSIGTAIVSAQAPLR